MNSCSIPSGRSSRVTQHLIFFFFSGKFFKKKLFSLFSLLHPDSSTVAEICIVHLFFLYYQLPDFSPLVYFYIILNISDKLTNNSPLWGGVIWSLNQIVLFRKLNKEINLFSLIIFYMETIHELLLYTVQQRLTCISCFLLYMLLCLCHRRR